MENDGLGTIEPTSSIEETSHDSIYKSYPIITSW